MLIQNHGIYLEYSWNNVLLNSELPSFSRHFSISANFSSSFRLMEIQNHLFHIKSLCIVCVWGTTSLESKIDEIHLYLAFEWIESTRITTT